MPPDIHALVQDTNNLDPGVGRSIKYQVFTNGLFQIAFTHVHGATAFCVLREAYAGIQRWFRKSEQPG